MTFAIIIIIGVVGMYLIDIPEIVVRIVSGIVTGIGASIATKISTEKN